MIYPFSISFTWHFDADLLSDEEILQRFAEALYQKQADKIQQDQTTLNFFNSFFSNKTKGRNDLMTNIYRGYIKIFRNEKKIKSKIYLDAPVIAIVAGTIMAYLANGFSIIMLIVPIFFYCMICLITYLVIYRPYNSFIEKIIDEEIY